MFVVVVVVVVVVVDVGLSGVVGVVGDVGIDGADILFSFNLELTKNSTEGERKRKKADMDRRVLYTWRERLCWTKLNREWWITREEASEVVSDFLRRVVKFAASRGLTQNGVEAEISHVTALLTLGGHAGGQMRFDLTEYEHNLFPLWLPHVPNDLKEESAIHVIGSNRVITTDDTDPAVVSAALEAAIPERLSLVRAKPSRSPIKPILKLTAKRSGSRLGATATEALDATERKYPLFNLKSDEDDYADDDTDSDGWTFPS